MATDDHAALGAFGLKPIAHITKTFAVARGGNNPELPYPDGTKQHTAFRARSRGELVREGASSPLGSVPRIVKFELRDLSPKLHLVVVC